MNKFKEASENIKKLQVMFNGLIELSSEMDKVDSLENHINELSSKKNDMLNEIDTISEKLFLVKTELEKSNSHALELKGDLINLENEKSLKIQQIDKECEELLKLAKIKVTKELDEINRKAQDNLLNLKNEIELKDIEIKSKSKKLEEINSALEKIKGGI